MKTTNIKGKPYVEVNERIKYLREHFPGYRLLTDIVELTDARIVCKARLFNDAGDEVANGIAYEESGSSFINKTSYIENCETSAWGRALGNFGIGIDASVASADEVANAIANQTTERHPVPSVGNLCRDIRAALNDLEDYTEEEVIAGINHKQNLKCEKLEEVPVKVLESSLNHLRQFLQQQQLRAKMEADLAGQM